MGEPLQTGLCSHKVPGSTLCLSLSPHLSQAANLAPRKVCARHRVPFHAACLSARSLSLSVVARLCQPHRLIPGTGWLSALLSLCLGLSAKPEPLSAQGLSRLSDWRCPISPISFPLSLPLSCSAGASPPGPHTPPSPPTNDRLGVFCFGCLLLLSRRCGEQSPKHPPPLHHNLKLPPRHNTSVPKDRQQ